MPEWTNIVGDENGIGAMTRLQFVDHGDYRIYRLVTSDPASGTQRVLAMTAVRQGAGDGNGEGEQ